jgi:hypothetical protein
MFAVNTTRAMPATHFVRSRLNLKYFESCPRSIYVFCMILTETKDYFAIEHEPVGIFDAESMCLL